MQHCLVLFTALSVASTAGADVINVPGDFAGIQDAIDAAIGGDEVVVAPGTYFETIDFLGKAITLRGSDGAASTIIDGTGFFHVVQCVSGEGPDTVLDGFTITGGVAGDVSPNDRGGGMVNDDSSPTVANCTFIDNEAVYGGGMFSDDSSPTVANCTFVDNAAARGGGMYKLGGSPTITNCTFIDNEAARGGGFYTGTGTATVTGCAFVGNAAISNAPGAGVGGGIAAVNASHVTVTDCTFEQNIATVHGGGIYKSIGPVGPLIVTDCTFSGNSASTGGGIECHGSVTLTGCTLRGNSASFGGACAASSLTRLTNCILAGNSAEVGGGMLASSGQPTAVNCAFIGNSATGLVGVFGGGIYTSSEPSVANCIFWNNAPESILVGDAPAPDVTYCIVQGGWPGTGNLDADPLFVDPDNGDFHLSPASPCIDAGVNATVPEGVLTDLDGNPRFLDVPEIPDTGAGDPPIVDIGPYESLGGGCLAIVSESVTCGCDGTTFTYDIEALGPCTGQTQVFTFAGSGGAVGEDVCFTITITGDGGGPCCTTQLCVPVPDCTPPCDLDGDGLVGVGDFLALLAAWGPCAGCGDCPADFDGDCIVGVDDFMTLLAHWS